MSVLARTSGCKAAQIDKAAGALCYRQRVHQVGCPLPVNLIILLSPEALGDAREMKDPIKGLLEFYREVGIGAISFQQLYPGRIKPTEAASAPD